MLVDDETDLLIMIKKFLERWGFVVDAFDKPEKALAHFEKNHADYSLVLTDVRMQGMTGIELANLMLRAKPDIKVILMTAFEVEPQDLARTLPIIKWQDILNKPFRLVEVCTAVKKQLQTA